MSNVSAVTPYENTRSMNLSSACKTVAGTCADLSAKAMALGRWLAEETPVEREVTNRLKEDRRKERLETRHHGIDFGREMGKASRMTTMDLSIRKPNLLISAAEKMGYRRESPLRHFSVKEEERPILLRNARGERLAIEKDHLGRIAVHTAGDSRRIERVVRQHTMDRALEHFKEKGMEVHTTKLANGEMQIMAREREDQRDGSNAEVKAEVKKDGSVLVDVEGIRDNRCEVIVAQFAQAIGGWVSSRKRKDFQLRLPQKPIRKRTKV